MISSSRLLSPIEADSELVERIATNGDAAAMAEFGARHSKTLYAIAYAVLFDPDAAEEAVAATFREVARTARRFVVSPLTAHRWLVETIRRIAVGHGFMAPEQRAPQWAQVRNESDCSLRRGAWYGVLAATWEAVVLDVHDKAWPVAPALVRIASERPSRWSVVRRPESPKVPPSWGVRYGVCPECQARSPLQSLSREMRCPRCQGVFQIDWNEW